MSNSTLDKDFRTSGIILRRTNYGEADRILNIITPHGKISAIAKGARKEKSKLAGGVEMFSLVDLNLHQGRSEFAIVTSARLVKYFSNIIRDFSKVEFASIVIKKISILSESSDNPEFFNITKQVFEALDNNIELPLIQTWFNFNIIIASGDEINLYRDNTGEKLEVSTVYAWDFYEKSLVKNTHGDISSDEIKIMRMIITNKLATIAKIKNIDEKISPIFYISKGL